MAKDAGKKISRRDFIKLARSGTLALGAASAGPFFSFPDRARARQKTLKVLQWKHFVPGYDQWFDDVFAKHWGQEHDTRVIVDHVPLEAIHARAAAEVTARKGHDLTMFVSPPAGYEKQVIDHWEVYREVEQKHGNLIRLAHRSTFNPKTKKYFAFADSYVPAATNFLWDRWAEIGLIFGPNDYETLRRGAQKIRESSGIPCGLGLAPELDSNVAMQALLWSFGGSVQDQRGNVTINSKGAVEALKYMKALYQESETPEVFTWDSSSNDRALLAGKVSCVVNAISIPRRAEKENPEMSKRIMVSPAPKGPSGWLAMPHITSCYVIWEFAENKEGAKRFLVDLIDNFPAAFKASGSCNFPCFPTMVPDLIVQLMNDPQADPHHKYAALKDALLWTTNLGHPGYATPPIEEVFNTFVIPRMFATVAKGDLSPEDAAAAAEREVKRIFEKWKPS